ncbi:hypothetical protein BDN71DRAFT_1429204 [Pleurotus eryngii]|uniref:CCL2-like lectin domain-containing protein n=1 Tax=Pleurotus eryngii TaxID=5323 RepID=A0A9P6A197_PLEER|nr:hypothetical protein BDN71DRAFT_1429204 [Pleurotus eryngii]
MVGDTGAPASAMPNPGTYYIVNRVLSPAGQKLALTFNGVWNTVTLTPQWCIRNYYSGATQSVSPASESHLEMEWAQASYESCPLEAIIQDGAVTVFWGLSDANVHQEVAFGDEDERGNQHWILIPDGVTKVQQAHEVIAFHPEFLETIAERAVF